MNAHLMMGALFVERRYFIGSSLVRQLHILASFIKSFGEICAQFRFSVRKKFPKSSILIYIPSDCFLLS